MPVQVTQSKNGRSYTHNIDLKGLPGGLFLIMLLLCLFHIIGFATSGWSVYSTGNGRSRHFGLWESCECGKSLSRYSSTSWFKATQATITIGLIFFIVALIATVLYLFVHFLSKNIALFIGIFGAGMGCLFSLIGLIIFGVKAEKHNWSYAFVCISTIFSFIAVIILIVLFRKAKD